jgi:4-diphosphocytidyl-2-C-methyl-D-erythritol kinase
MNQIVLSAPAKLNLTLDILGRRPDGYHEMDMLMQTIDLCDRIVLKRADTITLDACLHIPSGPDSIMWKTAEAFFAQTGVRGGVWMSVGENIPVRAGMGGGSADAAAVLYGLDRMYGTGLTAGQMNEIAVRIGADVPFALFGGTARVSGIGERLRRLPDLPPCSFAVCMPDYGVSTPEAFAAFDRIGAGARPDNDTAEAALRSGRMKTFCAVLANAMQKASGGADTEKLCSALKLAGADAALMTGSGSAVFGIFGNDRLASDALAALKKAGITRLYLVHPVACGTRIEEEI